MAKTIPCPFSKPARAYIAVRSVEDALRDSSREARVRVERRKDPLRDGKPYGQWQHERLVAFVNELRAKALHKVQPQTQPQVNH